jgi:cobalamin biosynthesis protein CobD/CbiB
MIGWAGAQAIVVALAVDQLFGEPPAKIHPVWVGRALASVGAPWPTQRPRAAFLRGMAGRVAIAARAAWGAALLTALLELA